MGLPRFNLRCMSVQPTDNDSSVGGGIMASAVQEFHSHANPIDRVERLAERERWAIDRTGDDEVVMNVTGGWCDLNLSLSWRSDLEALIVACTYDLRVTESRRDEVAKLIHLMNAQLIHGHFDFWADAGHIMYRNSLLLAGGAEANDAQCETLIRLGIEQCQRYYPAVQFAVWAGHSADQAMSSALLETHGEA
jgi:hypothetical protein